LAFVQTILFPIPSVSIEDESNESNYNYLSAKTFLLQTIDDLAFSFYSSL
jgi:hypothetical protein